MSIISDIPAEYVAFVGALIIIALFIGFWIGRRR